MSYFVYKDHKNILHCNQCHSQITQNKHGKFPWFCPACQAKLKKNPYDKITNLIVNAPNCPICKHSPTLLTATDYTYTDNAYSHHCISCLNCGGIRTNIHYSLDGVEFEWNELVKPKSKN